MQKADGTSLAANTAARFRATCHACLLAAVDAGAIEVDPWPRRTRSQSRRKALRKTHGVDIRSLPDLATMEAAIAAMANDKSGSLVYQALTAVAYYAGLRPSEVVMVRVSALDLPAGGGWGRIAVTEADDGEGNPEDPKTGRRIVPIPPVLVDRLARWIDERDLGGDDLLFRTATGARPNQQNWNRAWTRALALAGHRPLRVYDCRHAAATTWLAAGVPLGEVARRLGHSVETLVANYVGAIPTDEQVSNDKIEAAIAPAARPQLRAVG